MKSTSNISKGTNNKISSKDTISTMIPSSSSVVIRTTPSVGTVTKMVAIIVFLHILGIVFGFTIFYMKFRTECAQRILQVVTESNDTIHAIQQEQMSDDSNKLHQHQLIASDYQERTTDLITREKSMLDEQATLFKKHQDCLHSKSSMYEQMQSYQQQELSSKLQLHSATEERDVLRQTLLQKEQTIETIQIKSQQQQNILHNQLNLTKRMLHEKIEEVDRLEIGTTGTNGTSTNTVTRNSNTQKQTKEMIQLQTDIKRRDFSTMTHTYGKLTTTTANSYKVIFVVQSNAVKNGGDTSGGTVASLEIELNAVNEMPHTTYTILSMIEHQLYHDTSLQIQEVQSNNNNNKKTTKNTNTAATHIQLVGGHPTTCPNHQRQSKLKRHYAELGYNVQQLLYFTERNTKYSCTGSTTTASIGLSHHGPNLELYLPNSNNESVTNTTSKQPSQQSSSPQTCFGRIVAGSDTLMRMIQQQQQQQQQGNHNKMRLTIIDTRIVPINTAIIKETREEL